MTNETLRMQFLSGVITEGQYKIKLLNELQYFHNGAEMNQIINYDDSDITDDLEFLGQGSMDGQDFTPGSTYDIGGQEYKIESQGDEFKLVLAEALNESLNESMIGGIVGIGAINQIPPRAKADYETAFEHFLGGKYGLNEEEEENKNMFKVGNIVRITAPLDISAETDEGTITIAYTNFDSIPSGDIEPYEVDASAYDESALDGPWYKVDHNGKEELYPAEELELK